MQQCGAYVSHIFIVTLCELGATQKYLRPTYCTCIAHLLHIPHSTCGYPFDFVHSFVWCCCFINQCVIDFLFISISIFLVEYRTWWMNTKSRFLRSVRSVPFDNFIIVHRKCKNMKGMSHHTNGRNERRGII